MAANREDSIGTSIKKIWSRGHILGFYQGLIPWAWIEASTKGGVLLFTATMVEYYAQTMGASPFVSGIIGGMSGGIAQAYVTVSILIDTSCSYKKQVGFCTFMKTVEITRTKKKSKGVKIPNTYEIFMDKYRKEGIRGINRGANAVALRQMTNWGSRIGFSRLIESQIKILKNKDPSEELSALEKILASFLAGGLSCWNQPVEVVRIEMQSAKIDSNRPSKLGIISTLKGVTPRIGLSVWQTICMVALGDMVNTQQKSVSLF
ncbi:hypothetical protein PMAC_002414 [Pneumocystis sp. 'macacae']|nr:hypothetical protein PMAC_002414 [Pneumocystis sp. 'macacae']